VIFAGQCGIAGHIHLGDGVILSAKSGVDKSLTAGRYGGSPVMPIAEYNRMSVYLRNIEKYVKQLKKLGLQDND
jgi:UDP-3-O-[3-hydroxymyristoyl] glucosamine N-acyltransferase